MDTDVFFFSLPLVVPSQGLPQILVRYFQTIFYYAGAGDPEQPIDNRKKYLHVRSGFYKYISKIDISTLRKFDLLCYFV